MRSKTTTPDVLDVPMRDNLRQRRNRTKRHRGPTMLQRTGAPLVPALVDEGRLDEEDGRHLVLAVRGNQAGGLHLLVIRDAVGVGVQVEVVRLAVTVGVAVLLQHV